MPVQTSDSTPPKVSPLLDSPILLVAMIVAMVIVIIQYTVGIPSVRTLENISDFDIFYIVGQMVNAGDITRAYSYPTLLESQLTYTDSDNFMPWAYPPPFNSVVALLGTMPRWAAYGLFMTLTMSAWLYFVWQFGGRFTTWSLLSTLPAITVLIYCGQNGFLTGAIVAAACYTLLRNRPVLAGLLLGAMIIKPHLALGLGLFLLARGEWKVLGVAVLSALALLAASTLHQGVEIWPAFFNGTREAGEFLRLGAYPLFRMTSVYAFLHSFGAGPTLAMAGQALMAVCAGVIVWRFARDPRHSDATALGIACLCGLMFSPYSYDYDLTLLTIALALLAKPLIAHASRGEIVALTLLAAFSGMGILQHPLWIPMNADYYFSVAALSMIAILVIVVRVLQRAATTESQPNHQPLAA